MSDRSVRTLSRRRVISAGAGLVALAPFHRLALAAAPSNYKLSVRASTAALQGPHKPETSVWSYDGTVPGPLLRFGQGDSVRVSVSNLLDQATTIHWHGLRIPIAMDGVPGISQPPIELGQTFEYRFTPPDAGTFWYHPHANSLEQLGRGLAGPIIIEELEPIQVDRDVLWMLADWRLQANGALAPGFGNAMEGIMAGRLGTAITINGQPPADMIVRAGERSRLRLINAALARIMALRFEGHRPWVIAVDGQPCEPFEPIDGRLILGPAMRLDIVLDAAGEPGKRYAVVDDFYDGQTAPLTYLQYTSEAPVREHPLDAPIALPLNPVPEPDVTSAERHILAIGGGEPAGMHNMQNMDMGATQAWTLNGASQMGEGGVGAPALLSLKRDTSHVFSIQNMTDWWHPMHFHGHSMRVLTRNGAVVPHRQWADTVLLAPKDVVECAFVADNPGSWMFHCHVLDHQMAGLMASIEIS